jgi:hypothetical protein
MRQVKRNDLSHRMPPKPRYTVHPRVRAAAPLASAADPSRRSLAERRMRRDAPARRRGVRLAGKVFFGGSVPAPDDKRRHSALAGAELQAAPMRSAKRV